MARTPHRPLAGLVLGWLLLTAGCAALRDDMQRAENAYTAARYEDALVWLEDLESDTPDMDPDMRARFYYLRGMTAYRLGKRNHALHYLAVCREVAGEDGGALDPEWRKTMERLLEELTPTDASFRARTAQQAASGGSGGESTSAASPPQQSSADAGAGDGGGA